MAAFAATAGARGFESGRAGPVSTLEGPGTDTLGPDERLYPGDSIQSGNTVLTFQVDNHLVLYQGGTPIWASWRAVNAQPEMFVMQGDCNAAGYYRSQNIFTGEWTTVAGWYSRTDGQGSGCYAKVIEGDWFICNGSTRIWSARGGGSCDQGASCQVTDYVNQQQTTQTTYDVQLPFTYCSQLTGELPPQCSYYCAYIGAGTQHQAKYDVKTLKGTRTVRTGQPRDSCGNVSSSRFVTGDDSQPSNDSCWTLTATNCVDQYWRNPVGPRCSP